MVTGRYSRLLRSGTDEMTHFHTKRNRRRRALEFLEHDYILVFSNYSVGVELAVSLSAV